MPWSHCLVWLKPPHHQRTFALQWHSCCKAAQAVFISWTMGYKISWRLDLDSTEGTLGCRMTAKLSCSRMCGNNPHAAYWRGGDTRPGKQEFELLVKEHIHMIPSTSAKMEDWGCLTILSRGLYRQFIELHAVHDAFWYSHSQMVFHLVNL